MAEPFRAALRGMFQSALERLSADGVVAIAPEELPALVEQVRETADPKHGDFQCNAALGLAKAMQAKPREIAEGIVAGGHPGGPGRRGERKKKATLSTDGSLFFG